MSRVLLWVLAAGTASSRYVVAECAGVPGAVIPRTRGCRRRSPQRVSTGICLSGFFGLELRAPAVSRVSKKPLRWHGPVITRNRREPTSVKGPVDSGEVTPRTNRRAPECALARQMRKQKAKDRGDIGNYIRASRPTLADLHPIQTTGRSRHISSQPPQREAQASRSGTGTHIQSNNGPLSIAHACKHELYDTCRRTDASGASGSASHAVRRSNARTETQEGRARGANEMKNVAHRAAPTHPPSQNHRQRGASPSARQELSALAQRVRGAHLALLPCVRPGRASTASRLQLIVPAGSIASVIDNGIGVA